MARRPLAVLLTDWTERWIPDAFVFALVATVLVFGAGLLAGASALQLVDAWGKGFWGLLAFTLQMCLVILGGHVVADAAPVRRAIDRLALIPSTSKGAAAFVAFFAMATSWFNWGFSLVFSAILVRAIARRHRDFDYRALAAATLLGLGSVWAQGLSGSAALQMATPSALPDNIRKIVEAGGVVPGGVLPLTQTIFLWQSFVSVAVEIVVVTIAVYWLTPAGEHARSAAALGISLDDPPLHTDADDKPTRPGEWLEHQPWLSLLVVALGGVYVARELQMGVAALSLNVINLTLLLLAFLLHRTPARLMRAFARASTSIWSVILQFPFYAGIAGMIAATSLNDSLAHAMMRIATRTTFPALMATYSAVLGVFIPSGGGKWLVEAPYVMQAAHGLRVHLGWVVACYDLGEALANLVQPFWMLPVLGLLGLRARDVMGYTLALFVILLPLVLILVTVLGATLPYPVSP